MMIHSKMSFTSSSWCGIGSEHRESEVPCQLKTEKRIFLLSPDSDVMDDQGCAIASLSVADDHDVRKPVNTAGHKIAGEIVARVVRDGDGPALSRKKALLIENAPMVDIAVGSSQKPFALSRVFAEIRFHVGVHQFLKIQLPRVAKRSDNDIRTHPLSSWNVAVWIADLAIVGDIVRCHANLRSRGDYDVDIVGTGLYVNGWRRGHRNSPELV